MIHDAPEAERRRLRRLLHSLPRRQSQCACWAFRGLSNKEIGHELGCATGTVKSHLSKVYARLGLQHKSAFVKRAIMVKMMIDTSTHHEAGAEMRQLFSPRQIDNVPGSELLEVSQSSDDALAAQSIQSPEQKQVELPLRCCQQHALKLRPNFPARACNGIDIFHRNRCPS